MPDKFKRVEIKSRGLRRLGAILEKYLELNKSISVAWRLEEFPWWYNERASTGVLAAAAWKCNAIAFEEYATDKRHRKRGKRQAKNYTGRNDLYLKIGKREYILEAKNVFPTAFPTPENSLPKIRSVLKQAIHDVKNNRESGVRKLAAVFVAPRFYLKRMKNRKQAIGKWIDVVSKIRCSARAWIFPNEAIKHAESNGKRLYPGVVLILKEVG